MPRFAANISLMYPEWSLVERIGAAARDGFAAVEVQGPYSVPAAEFRRALHDASVQIVLMNAPHGPAQGDHGLAAMPGREADFAATLDAALDYAATIGAPRLHVLSGRPGPGIARADCLRTYCANLQLACDRAAAHGITVMIEPLNTRDNPGVFLTHQQQAADVMVAVARANLKLQFDFYHLQIMEGDLLRHLRQHIGITGHVQVAGAPDRHEPDTGEIHYPVVFAELDRLGYAGWVGCEYRPARGAVAGGTSLGLGWLRRC
jgi:hydroxypyruvate isomerase